MGGSHDTELIVTDWAEAERVMEAERIAAVFADENSTTVAEFEEILDQAEFEVPDVPSDEAPAFISQASWYGVNQLEVGVAGLVYALNAVGIVTAASCRGHSEAHRRWANGPIVVFASNEPRARALAELVVASGCGFDINTADHPDLLAVTAPSITEMMGLADQIRAHADAFSRS
ncbi:hypothetical protein [Microbacterium sp.]|uniref:hypothetical protein n=1 Tax=Microbacterium sp. TaxID=51671 RepID=UPI003A95ABF7